MAQVDPKLKIVFFLILMCLGAGVVAVAASLGGVLGLVGIIAGLIGICIVAYLWKEPFAIIGLVILLGFTVTGMNRYVNAPTGLLIDGALSFGIILILLRLQKPILPLYKNVAILVSGLWLLVTILELFNPLAVSWEAWIYAVRGISLYFFGTCVVAAYCIKSEREVDLFVLLWLLCALIGALWGIKQSVLGLDMYENIWLQTWGKKTHILFGKIRFFSFFSDAGQFGAAMGHATVVAGVLALGPYLVWKRVVFAGVALICFYGLMISGTRGALFVIVGGAIGFVILSRNIRFIFITFFFGFCAFAFLKFTSIGQGNYDIRRLRTALDPNDASFQVRIDNQKVLADYLVDKPFGGGIGSGGSWGARFSPDTFLAQVPYDSWYVKIWAETGIVGLVLYIICLLLLAVFGAIRVQKCKSERLRFQLLAVWSGYIGIIIASYGNQVFGQAPTSVLIYISLIIVMQSKRLKPHSQLYLT